MTIAIQTAITAARIKVRAPAGATFLQVTDSKGRHAVLPISSVNHGANVLRGVDVVAIAAGIKTSQGKFTPMLGAPIDVVAVNQTKPKEPIAMKNVQDMTAVEIVNEYNQLTGESVQRFSTRAAAETRLIKARAVEIVNEYNQLTAKPTAKPAPKPVLSKELAEQPTASVRSDATKESWSDKAVAKARKTRHRVKVGGHEYRSVKAAFVELKLPLSKHIPFRLALKQAGKATLDGHHFTAEVVK